MSKPAATLEQFEFRPVHPALWVFLVIGGLVFLGLGVLAMVIPGLPATPFLLLALAAFARSSRRLHTWLLTNPYLGPHLRAWRQERAIELRVKLFALAIAWGVLLYLALFVAEPLWLKILLVGVALAKSVVMIKIKTRRHRLPKVPFEAAPARD